MQLQLTLNDLGLSPARPASPHCWIEVCEDALDFSKRYALKAAPRVTCERVEGVKEGAWVFKNTLSSAECDRFIRSVELRSGWSAANRDKRYRDCDKVSFLSSQLAEMVKSRLDLSSLPASILRCSRTMEEAKESGVLEEVGTEGNWEATGLNNFWRVCRYGDGGHFVPHVDGAIVQNSNHRSFLTVMLYLTSGFEGGETVFLSGREMTAAITPEPGLCLVFWQNAWHAGSPVVRDDHMPMKYILRSEVMYSRRAGGPDGFPPEGVALLRRAAEADTAGDCPTAIKLYNQLRRRFPDIALAAGIP